MNMKKKKKSQNIDTSACPDNLASNLKMIEGVEKVVRKVMEIAERREKEKAIETNEGFHITP